MSFSLFSNKVQPPARKHDPVTVNRSMQVAVKLRDCAAYCSKLSDQLALQKIADECFNTGDYESAISDAHTLGVDITINR